MLSLEQPGLDAKSFHAETSASSLAQSHIYTCSLLREQVQLHISKNTRIILSFSKIGILNLTAERKPHVHIYIYYMYIKKKYIIFTALHPFASRVHRPPQKVLAVCQLCHSVFTQFVGQSPHEKPVPSHSSMNLQMPASKLMMGQDHWVHSSAAKAPGPEKAGHKSGERMGQSCLLGRKTF